MIKEKINKRILTLFALALFLIPIVSAITYPILNGYVTDNANIITPQYREKITNLADRINKNTTVEIAVLTVDSLEGDSPENYALQTFRQNGVGKKDNNNGLLILVAKKERKYKFEVGYGLEGTIPDAMKVPIGDKIITPNFKQGEYGKGIYESMLVIEGLTTNNTEVLSKYGIIQNSGNGGGGSGESGGTWIFLLAIIVFGAIVIYAIIVRPIDSVRAESPPSLPTTYRPPSYTRSGSSTGSSSSNRRSSSYSSYSSGSSHISHSSSHSFGGGFGGFGGGRSGGGGFGGGW